MLDENDPSVTLSLLANPRFRLVPRKEALPAMFTVEFAAFVIEPVLTIFSVEDCTMPSNRVLLSSETAVLPVVLAESEPSCTVSLFAKPRLKLVPLNDALPEMLTVDVAALVIEPALTMLSDAA